MIELIFVIFSQITHITPRVETKITIQTTKEESYFLLTRKQPVEITVSGPTWLRVYTRIPWSGDKKETKFYKIILQEDDLKEKFITLESEYSRVSRIDNIRLSKWRSFYINVPEGSHSYRFIHWRAPGDTIFLRFTNESPGKWKDITPLSYNAKLELVENERIIYYFEATQEKPVILEIEGPKKLKIISRFNLKTDTQGEQFYSIIVKEKGKTVKSVSYHAYPSETVHYSNRPGTLPSNPHTFFLNVRKGLHRYEFYIENRAECGLRFLIESK
ncbi:MAG: hypothetical protein ABIL40_07970 [candidate division WOR-3 bacterium]